MAGNGNSRTGRSPSIELLRILLMFGVCLLHVCERGQYAAVWPKCLLCSCVVGFVFISGYFGVRFSMSKALRLEGLAVICSAIVPLLGGAVGRGEYLSGLWESWTVSKWFLHAYAILLCIAPMLDSMFNGRKNLFALTLPYLCVVFGWGYLTNMNHTKGIVPDSAGLTSHSVMTMLGIYLVGRIFRLYQLERFLQGGAPWLIGVVCGVLLSVFGTFSCLYNNPLHLLFVAAIFVVFKNIRLNDAVGHVILKVAPSMFSVYILHGMIYLPMTQHGAYAFMNQVRDGIINADYNRHLAYLLTALLVFSMSLAVDLVRRGVMKTFKKRLSIFYSSLDALWNRLSARLDERLAN